MSCYEAYRPSDHLQFNEDGSVEAANVSGGGMRVQSQHGYETIRTMGLDRHPLRNERRGPVEDVHEALRRFAEGNDAESVSDLCRLGDARRPFAGVVRAIVEQQLEMSWDEFLAGFATS
jgi:hypothetical protein